MIFVKFMCGNVIIVLSTIIAIGSADLSTKIMGAGIQIAFSIWLAIEIWQKR